MIGVSNYYTTEILRANLHNPERRIYKPVLIRAEDTNNCYYFRTVHDNISAFGKSPEKMSDRRTLPKTSVNRDNPESNYCHDRRKTEKIAETASVRKQTPGVPYIYYTRPYRVTGEVKCEVMNSTLPGRAFFFTSLIRFFAL